jgi:NADH-quinone oxidoreductase chain G
MEKEQVTLTIDNKTVTVPKGTMVVDAAKAVDIDIPVFCYHEKLGPFGCCRMCLVEVEKMPRLTTACTLVATQDMIVKTDTPKVRKGRQGVLEFTLLNHPLDCPVCDKGGECPLQNNTFKYGPDVTRINFDRAHNDKAIPLSPVITIDRERCIACQRCTRYSDIIEQETALVMLNRGFYNEVNTFNDQPYVTRFSGNVIDICPVGALTNTQFRFKARSWDLKTSETLCAHCGCNCNMNLDSRLNKFMRVQGRDNNSVNDGWICDKGRFGYGFIESENRILQARKTGGKSVLLEEACQQAITAFKKIVDQHGPNSVGFIGSPFGSNEELYLYQKLFRLGLGTNNIDHKTYKDTPGLPIQHYDFENIETSNLILLIASDPAEELPILELRIKKALRQPGVKLVALNDQQTVMDKFASQSIRYNIGTSQATLTALANVLAKDLGQDTEPVDAKLESISGVKQEDLAKLSALMRASLKICVIYNPASLTGDSISALKYLLSQIQKIPTVECGAIPAAPGTNAVGAMDMGVLPDYYPGGAPLSSSEEIKRIWGEKAPLDKGLSALDMIKKAGTGELKALWVYRANPIVDFPGGKTVASALGKLELLVAHDMLETETARMAHWVLPSNGPGYDDGTTTNIGGRVQYRRRGLSKESQPDWKIISAMARSLGDTADYKDSFCVTKEISEKVPAYGEINKKSIKMVGKNRGAISCTTGKPEAVSSDHQQNGALRLRVSYRLFAQDKILEASSPLSHHFKKTTIFLHEKDAISLRVKTGDGVSVISGDVAISAVAVVSNSCNPGGVILPKSSDDAGLMSLANNNGSVAWVLVKR